MKSSYRDLRVWQLAMDVGVEIYGFTGTFPRTEVYGLSQQMRRAAVSISSNIAEGYGRRSAQQRYSFLEQALGSLFELETQAELSKRLGFIEPAQFARFSNQLSSLGRSMTALMKYVESEGGTSRRKPTR